MAFAVRSRLIGIVVLSLFLFLALAFIPNRASSKDVEIRLVNRVTRFGERQDLKLEGVVGSRLTNVLQAEIVETLLDHGVSVLFRHTRHDAKNHGGQTVVENVYPEVFYAGCVLVIECSGPLPSN